MNGSRNILIVDDDVEFAEMVAEAVRDVSAAFIVQVSRDAVTALAQVKAAQASARSYDLVITDIKMPGSSGLQLVEALAEIAPETKTITMTAYHSTELAARAQQLRVHAYLIKPIALSEFRQVVRAALPAVQRMALELLPTSYSLLPTPDQLPAAQRMALERRLANLRAITNSTMALLAHADGTILAVDSLDTNTDARVLYEALIDAMQAVAQAMRHSLNTDAPIQQSYYGTEALSICTYRMDSSHVIVTVFGPAVREGNVWYCMREAATDLSDALSSQAQDRMPPRDQAGEDWRTKIEQLFTNATMGRVRNRPGARSPRASTANVTSQAGSAVDQPAATPPAGSTPVPSPAGLEPARTSRDQIDWDSATGTQWDSASAETREALGRDSDREASERGLHTSPPPAASTTGADNRLSVDEINWEVSVDLDWDRLVANTDQGFAGMDFEEAKKRGLIDDLDTGGTGA